MLLINKTEVPNNGYFAFDGCHKIYILENIEDVYAAMQYEYEILPVSELKDKWEASCGLRFIERWNMEDGCVKYIPQCFEDDVIIEIGE